MRIVKAVELIFLGDDIKCPKCALCTCSEVLVDVTTTYPIIEDGFLFNRHTIDAVDAVLSDIHGIDRLVVFFVIFLQKNSETQILEADYKNSYVHHEFSQWGHKHFPIGGGCRCELCRQSNTEPYARSHCDPHWLSKIPVDFLSSCALDLKRRISKCILRYNFLQFYSLENLRDTFKVKTGSRHNFSLDFLENSGVGCIRPHQSECLVYLTLPIVIHLDVVGLIPSSGFFYCHAPQLGSTSIRIKIEMNRHDSLVLPGTIKFDIFSLVSDDNTESLEKKLSHLSNHHVRCVHLNVDKMAQDSIVPCLKTTFHGISPPCRFLGWGAKPRKRFRSSSGLDILFCLCTEKFCRNIEKECLKFGNQADSHAFAVAIGLSCTIEKIATRCYFIVEYMLQNDMEWKEAVEWKRMFSDLHMGVCQRSSPSDFDPLLWDIVVPIMFLEVLYDALMEGPFWCSSGAPKRHMHVSLKRIIVDNTIMEDELKARGCFDKNTSFQDKRRTIEDSVYSNRFEQVLCV